MAARAEKASIPFGTIRITRGGFTKRDRFCEPLIQTNDFFTTHTKYTTPFLDSHTGFAPFSQGWRLGVNIPGKIGDRRYIA